MAFGAAVHTRRKLALWLLLFAIIAVAAGGATKIWWPNHHVKVKVLGTKSTAQPSPTISAGNSGCGNGNGGSNGKKDCSNPGHPIKATGFVVGTLFPGVTSALRVTVDNPNNQDLTLTAVTATIGTPNKTGCLSSWFTVGSYSGATTVKKNNQATVDIPFSMLDKPLNQDACKTATVPVSFTATAQS